MQDQQPTSTPESSPAPKQSSRDPSVAISDAVGDSPFLPPVSPREDPPSEVAHTESGGDLPVTLDASRASWNRKVDLARKSAELMVPESSGVVSDSEENPPPRKKRRSEVEKMIPAPPFTLAKKGSARENLRTMLAGFSQSASGSQPIVARDEDGRRSPIDVDEDLAAEEVDSDEVMNLETGDSAPSEVDEAMVVDELADEPQTTDETDIIDLTDDDIHPSELMAPASSLNDVVARPEVLRTLDGSGDLTLRLDLDRIGVTWKRRNYVTKPSGARISRDDNSLSNAGIADGVQDDVAAETLGRTIEKQDFGAMDVLGQFNLGFIVVRRRPADGAMDDLFIVDQHAADEKYNFESLQRTTQIRSQKLFRPRQLELTAGDELLALENVEVLQQNGFEVATEANEAPGRRLRLTGQPVSKDTVFDMKGGWTTSLG
ncbi:unnamed protein product [Mycena citricolor]|uniref:MutL C-terminal dimerisation domain-containing protein n=1 Tax=Mycena citricolor TaxID=2018698 RepID=A0AAD2HL58_9AGAR|nr:unnamed protein product [Mycena citricolor]